MSGGKIAEKEMKFGYTVDSAHLYDFEWLAVAPAPKTSDGGGRFQMYVDLDWHSKKGFRVYELFEELQAGRGVSKGTVLAREWNPAKILLGKDSGNVTPFMYKTPKPQRLKWMPRRSRDGVLQSTVLSVAGKIKEVMQAGKKVEYLVIEGQADRVTEAYTKLFAMRAIGAYLCGECLCVYEHVWQRILLRYT